MSGGPPLVSWQPLLTNHQSYTLQALERAAGTPVTVMIAQLEDPARKAQGWTRAQSGSLDVHLLDSQAGIRGIIRALREHGHSVHLFSSPFDKPHFMLALFIAIWKGLTVYLISEPFSPVNAGYLHDRRKGTAWIKSILRPWLYRLYGLILSRGVRGVFAISPLAMRQYRAMGIPKQRIHPFGYFVPGTSDSHVAPHQSPQESGARAVFVGNLIERKGISELIEAAREVRDGGVRFSVDVYGAGDPTAFEFDEHAVCYAGTVPFGHAQSVIANYDFLVLPSRYDGWGVVVNEAILAGVPVVCSDRVGAGAFVKQWGCGVVYPADTPGALAEALRSMSGAAALRTRTAASCRQSRHLLAPAVAGSYIAAVISSGQGSTAQPPNPWYDA